MSQRDRGCDLGRFGAAFTVNFPIGCAIKMILRVFEINFTAHRIATHGMGDLESCVFLTSAGPDFRNAGVTFRPEVCDGRVMAIDSIRTGDRGWVRVGTRSPR
jgi:hypothetical protein